MQRLEGYLQSFLIFLMAIGGTIVVLLWGTLNGARSSSMENSVKLQQDYKEIYDRIQYGTPYPEIDALVKERLRVYCSDDAPLAAQSSERWCHWQGAPELTLSIKFNAENRATEKKLYYDKEIGL